MHEYDAKLWDSGTRPMEAKDKLQLLQEIRKAHADWVAAQHMFEYALDHDQIDQAIYLLNAAEKRFDMLYKLAKRIRLSIVRTEGGEAK